MASDYLTKCKGIRVKGQTTKHLRTDKESFLFEPPSEPHPPAIEGLREVELVSTGPDSSAWNNLSYNVTTCNDMLLFNSLIFLL